MLRRLRRLAAMVCVAGPLLIAAPARAATITVATAGDLQAALNTARSGDTVELQRGATFVGNFVLPKKDNSTFITVETAGAVGLVTPGRRVGPPGGDRLAR